MRFITVLSERVYEEVNGGDAEYGFVMAKTSAIEKRVNGDASYTLQYKGANVNGVNTETSYSYVQNMKCSGVPDHYNGKTYRLYTAVITYNGLEGDALTAAYATAFTARSYIHYTDINGLTRVYYNNYVGAAPAANGCSASFTAVQGMRGA